MKSALQPLLTTRSWLGFATSSLNFHRQHTSSLPCLYHRKLALSFFLPHSTRAVHQPPSRFPSTHFIFADCSDCQPPFFVQTPSPFGALVSVSLSIHIALSSSNFGSSSKFLNRLDALPCLWPLLSLASLLVFQVMFSIFTSLRILQHSSSSSLLRILCAGNSGTTFFFTSSLYCRHSGHPLELFL